VREDEKPLVRQALNNDVGDTVGGEQPDGDGRSVRGCRHQGSGHALGAQDRHLHTPAGVSDRELSAKPIAA